MKKQILEFYDISDVIQLMDEHSKFNIFNVFHDFQLGDPFESWCKFHNINPYRTKTKYDLTFIDQWSSAKDRENFYAPHVDYSYQIQRRISNINKYFVGEIDLSTFEDEVNKSIGIENWSIYWTKYEGTIYSLNKTFLELFMPFSIDNKLSVFIEPEYYD